ncbi:MAG: peroxide stress protein YaaA [Gammaproteobacteria bacterium]|nr:peroxide stress protein YaaA [Gammaproteobacteria bacterium]MCP5406654.1 peroxide stress protein YaaA [Chromatiaceae bacterium]MCP5444382.1 peroxide stress protein YaaA [Chromatiaceae bacterium]
MLLVISPAKTLDYQSKVKIGTHTIPEYLDDAQLLINRARGFSVLDIAELMQVSINIAELNFERFHSWSLPFTVQNARQAVLAFKGDVYTGLDVDSFTSADFKYAQAHLRILSGLYGLLRPLDLMQPYRMEMGRKIETERGHNLYQFWREKITDGLNKQLQRLKSRYLINLASQEYFKSIESRRLIAEIITPEFREWKGGQYRMIGVYAKQARGRLSRFIIRNRLTEPEAMQGFDADGYRFNDKLSSDAKLVFTRRQ